MPTFERITTEYIDLEDRIRLAGEVGSAAPVVIWLTQRLLQRLLPALLQWLERQGDDMPRAEVLHSFAQQAARAELTPQAPVRAVAGCAAWLALAVDITRSEQVISLTFRGADGHDATLILAAKPLRQWLSIVHDAYLKAAWPLNVWPSWVAEGTLSAGQQSVVLH